MAPFLETLARLRPDPWIASAEIAGDPRDEDFPTAPAGVVPVAWLDQRAFGTAHCEAPFAAVGHARSLAYLREALAPVVVRHGLDELDAATIRARAPRRFTQELSRHVYECTTAHGDRAFQGVCYRSRLGDDLTNWAICEPASIDVVATEEVRRDDPDLLRAVELLAIVLP